MPLTKKEQKTFDSMFLKIQAIHPDSLFIDGIADLIFEMTGLVNLRMRFSHLARKLSRKK